LKEKGGEVALENELFRRITHTVLGALWELYFRRGGGDKKGRERKLPL